MDYNVGEEQLKGLEDMLKNQIVTEGSKNNRVETITLPKITSYKHCHLNSVEWKQSMQALIDECQPLKIIEQQSRKIETTVPIVETTRLPNIEETVEQPQECPYKKISHSDRINYIYMNKVLDKDKMWISQNQGINYTTVQHILKTYERSGRTNKKQFLNIDYLQGTKHVSAGNKAKLGRGRKRLELDKSVLLDAFCEQQTTQRCSMKLYVDQKLSQMRVFKDKIDYPYSLGNQMKELEIINKDIHKGDEESNNIRELF